MKNNRNDWRRAAVVVAAGVLAAAGVVATATPAAAQTRQDNGRALDSNSRVGSGGRNEGSRTTGGPAVSGNQIITGNVTAGRQFRGFVPYSDPGSFRGITAGSLSTDRFVRDSAGAPTRYGSEVDLTNPTAYYGSKRVAPPPVGYLPTAGATGGYVGTEAAAAANDLTQNQGLTRAYNSSLDPTFRSSELIMPTQDAANGDSVLSASPLYGVRVWRSGESPNDFLAGQRNGWNQGPSGQGQNGSPNGQNGQNQQPGQRGYDRGDRFRNDPNSIQRMRDELNRSADQGAFDSTGQGNNGPGQGGGQSNANQGFNRALNSGLDQTSATATDQTPGGAGVGVGALNSTVGNGTAIQSSVATGQSIQRRLVVSPEKQTPQLAKLRRAYEQQHPGESTDVQSARQFTREYQAQFKGAGQQGNAGPGAGPAAGPGATAPGGAGGLPPAPRGTKAPPVDGGQPPAATPGATTPDAGAPQAQPQGQPPAAAPAQPPAQPERIGSIAEGVQAQGLRDVLTSAEALMKDQKFAEALQQYEVARQVAPNNALITMGRANAELAASYYRRAETSLRDAVGRAPELVVAQFDLRGLVGEERLQTVVKDLKELAANDPKQARPMLLLAYIAYNTGSEAQAGEYLAAAEQRTGGDDALLKAWRRNWRIPSGGEVPAAQPGPESSPQPDANK